MAKIKVTQKKSVIGRPKDQKRTVRALGLKRINDVAVHDDKPEIRGMINKVIHLLQIEEEKGRQTTDDRRQKSNTAVNRQQSTDNLTERSEV